MLSLAEAVLFNLSIIFYQESQETLRELTQIQVKHSLALQEISTLKNNLQTTNRQREQVSDKSNVMLRNAARRKLVGKVRNGT